MDWILANLLQEQEEKGKMLSQPVELAKRVADVVDPLVPSLKKPSTKFTNQVEGVESVIPSDHPMKGFPTQVYNDVVASLQDPRYAGRNTNDILRATVANRLQNSDLLEKSYAYKRVSDSSVTNFFGLFGESDIKKPPGYDQWLPKQKLKEDARLEEEGWFAGPEDIAKGAAIGGSIGALFGIPGGPAGMLAGAQTGAVTMAIAEPLLHPIKRALHGTEWYQARESSDSWVDKGKNFLADAGVDLAAFHFGPKFIKQGLALAAEKDFLGKATQETLGKFEQTKSAAEAVKLGRMQSDMAKVDDAFAKLSLIQKHRKVRAMGDEDLYEFIDRSLNIKQVSSRPYSPTEMLAETEAWKRDLTDRIVLDKDMPGGVIRMGEGTAKTPFMKQTPGRGIGIGQSGRGGSEMMEDNAAYLKEMMGVEAGEVLPRGTLVRAGGSEGLGRTGTTELSNVELGALRYGNRGASNVDVGRTAATEMTEEEVQTLRWLQRDPLQGAAGKRVFAELNPEYRDTTLQLVDRGATLREATAIAKQDSDAVKRVALQEEYMSSLANQREVMQRATQGGGANVLGVKEGGYAPKRSLPTEWQRVVDAETKDMLSAAAKRNQISPGVSSSIQKLTDEQSVYYAGKGVADTMEAVKETKTAIEALDADTFAKSFVEKMERLRGIDPATLGEANVVGRLIETPELKAAVDKALEPAKKMTKEQRTEKRIEDAAGKVMAILRKKGGVAMVIPTAAIGTYALMNAVSDDKAYAGVASSIANEVPAMVESFVRAEKAVGKRGVQIMKDLADAHLDRAPIRQDQLRFTRPQQTISLSDSLWSAIESKEGVFKRTKGLPFGLDRFLDMFTSGRLHYKEGLNPAVEMAMKQEAFYNNTEDALQVASNFLRRVPGVLEGREAVQREVMDAFAPIAKRYSADVGAYRAVEMQLDMTTRILQDLQNIPLRSTDKAEFLGKIIDTTEQQIAKLNKVRDQLFTSGATDDAAKLAAVNKRLDSHYNRMSKYRNRLAEGKVIDPAQLEADIAARSAEVAKLEEAQRNLRPSFDSFMTEWEMTAKSMAQKHAGVRLSLAAEDTSEFVRYPWLKSLMTKNELTAVPHIKQWHMDYATRMEAAGFDTIKDMPYVHHAWHPDWSLEAAAKKLADIDLDVADGIPLSKFFQRGKYSVQMVPEINFNMSRYALDTEKRLAMSDFWRIGNPKGWYAHANSPVVQGNPAIRDYWQRMRDASLPASNTRVDTWFNRYTAFEVNRLIGLSPSVSLKHFFKNTGTLAALGLRENFGVAPEAARTAYRNALANATESGMFKGTGISVTRDTLDQFVRSFTHQNQLQNILTDLEINPFPRSAVDRFMDKTTKIGSKLVGSVENFDRSLSVLASLNMAAKEGLTANQALYGIYDTILKNNFLGGMINASWMKDPKIRALFLFQSTPFKIFERRLINAMEAGSDLKATWGVIRNQDIGKTLRELKDLGMYIGGAERSMKENMIHDALSGHRDIFGTPATSQFMKEILISGAVLSGGGALGMDLMPQVGHLPFLKPTARDPALGTSPMIGSLFETASQRNAAKKAGDDPDFILSSFLKNWLGSQGVVPLTVHKAMQFNSKDIPERYAGSWLKYFFAVPAAKE